MSSSMGERPARIDVVIAVHSVTRPIARAVSSILNHNNTPTRVIVVAHNIPSDEIAVELGGWADDPRVTLSNLFDGINSPSGPMNHGIDLATADYVSLLGSDDTLEVGALDRWYSIAKSGANFVIANRLEPNGTFAPSPPVRIGRRTSLVAAKDRLAYRAAPLGLWDRNMFADLRFPEGIPTGEDVPFSARIWFSDASIAFAFGSPGYKVHADQEQRVTTTPRPIKDQLAWVDEILNPSQPWMRSKQDRRSFILKILRQNIPDTLATHLPDTWDASSATQLADKIDQLRNADPDSLCYLSITEWRLVDELLKPVPSPKRLTDLLNKRSNIRSVASLLPKNPILLLSRHAPLRLHLAALALTRAGQANSR